MEIIVFNEQSLVTDLGRLPSPFRVVFAAACAERFLPAYVSFSGRTGRGDATMLSAILERLWLDVQGDRMDTRQVQENVDLLMDLIPQEDAGSWVPEQAWAEDAAAAVAYALRCRQNGQAQEAAWAARRAYEALDHFVIAKEGIDTNKAGAAQLVLAHPLVQAELLRQQRDLRELLAENQEDLLQVAQRMRQRAKVESEVIFQPKPR